MLRGFHLGLSLLAATLTGASAAAQDGAEPVQPPPHTTPWPGLGTGTTEAAITASYDRTPEYRRDLSATQLLEQRRRLDAALAAIQPQRPGTVDAYVVTVALDSDPVFAREAREAGTVLTRRYDAQGRAITLAGPDGRQSGLPHGSISALTLTLAHIAGVMDPAEDVLVLYTTSHGTPQGLAYHYGDSGFGILSPSYLRDILQELRIERRVVMISACYSGIFVGYLSSPDTALMTAAARDRTSFGCLAENDWTYFGDALVNRAMRKPREFELAAREAAQTISGWEAADGLTPSMPQTLIGTDVVRWLPALEARIPREATQPVGRPAAGE